MCFFTNSGHYVNWVRYSNKWHHCNDHIIKDYPLLTSSKEVYLLFYIKQIDISFRLSEVFESFPNFVSFWTMHFGLY